MAFNPLHAGRTPPVLMVAILRFSDKTVVASYAESQEITVEGVRELIASNASCLEGKRYSSVGASQAVHYILDKNGRVYTLVSEPKYPPRVAFTALDELMTSFHKEFGYRVAAASEGSLSKTSRPLLKDIIDKYSNVAGFDKLTQVSDRIDVVKTVMKENIQQMLMNEEKLKKIEESSEQLNQQSAQFKASTKELQNKMWWKKVKMWLLLGFLITAVLLIIIVPVAVTNSQSNDDQK